MFECHVSHEIEFLTFDSTSMTLEIRRYKGTLYWIGNSILTNSGSLALHAIEENSKQDFPRNSIDVHVRQ